MSLDSSDDLRELKRIVEIQVEVEDLQSPLVWLKVDEGEG